MRPRFHISYWRAIGRRLRSNYAYILAIQAIAYYGKLAIHPLPAGTWTTFLSRAAVGPLPGWIVVLCGRRLPRQLDRDRDRHLRIEQRYRRAAARLISIA